MLSIDFHVHTHYSIDALLSPRMLLRVAKKKRLDGVAVADHGTTRGVKALSKVKRTTDSPLIIPGVEIRTSQGELLLLFEVELPFLKGDPYPPVADVLEAAREIDAVIVLPHPFDRLRKGMNPLIIKNQFDVIESFNSRALIPQYNIRARTFAINHGIPQCAGSDAHTRYEVGGARTTMQTNRDDLEEIRKCLIRGETKITGRLGNPIYRILGWAWRVTRPPLKG